MRVLITVIGQTTKEAKDLVSAPALNVTTAGNLSFNIPEVRASAAAPPNPVRMVSSIGPKTAKYNPAPNPTRTHAGPVPRHNPFTPSSARMPRSTTPKWRLRGISAACMCVLITSRGCNTVVLIIPAPPPATNDAKLLCCVFCFLCSGGLLSVADCEFSRGTIAVDIANYWVYHMRSSLNPENTQSSKLRNLTPYIVRDLTYAHVSTSTKHSI